MKSFLDKAGKFIFGLFGLIISIFGIFAYFQKSDSETLANDDKLADEELEVDKQIAEKSGESIIEDLDDKAIEDYWNDK